MASSANARLERLLNLTAALLTASRPLSSADILERVPGYPEGAANKATFQRQFERDKDALREMGVPLSLVEIPGTQPPESGYLIRRDDYALRDPGLLPDELAAIHLALAAVRLDGLPSTEALWKLGGSPDADDAPDAGTVAALPSLPQLVPAFGAIASRSAVSFDYRGERRTVDPHRLSFSRGHWYLDGRDHARGAARQFRLDRIDGELEVGPAGTFERPASTREARTQPWEMGGDEPVVARVLIDAVQARWALDQLGRDATRATHDDGSIEVEVTVSNREGFRSFVLGFLDHAEVLSPPELRADLVAWLQAMAGAA
jgi:predicted DNA-binding transcriptional regulator YafY